MAPRNKFKRISGIFKRKKDTDKNNITAPESSSSSSKPSPDSFIYRYTWDIKDFEDLIGQDTVTMVLSEKFTSPSSTATNETRSSNLSENPGYTWRLALFPNGHKVENYLSLYLKPYRTEYEQEKGYQSRQVKFYFDLLHKNTSEPNSEYKKVEEAVSKITERNFNLSKSETDPFDWGYQKFCPTRMFTGGVTDGTILPKTNFLIRVSILDQEQADVSISDAGPSQKFVPSLDKFIDDSKSGDIEFSFGCGSRIKADRQVLASRSSYFDKMFGGKWAESKSSKLTIKNCNYQCFRAIIYFIYTDNLEVDLSFDTLKELLVESDMRQIVELTNLVTQLLLHRMDKENWNELLILGWQISNESLKKAVLLYAHENWEKIKASDNMQQVVDACDDIQKIEELVCAKVFGVK